MRILVNAFAASVGGGKWFTGALIQELARQNPDWHFLVFYASEDFVKDWSNQPNIELHHVPQAVGYRRRILWQQWKWRKVIKDRRIELIFSPLNVGVFKPSVPQITVHRNAHHVVAKVTKHEGGKWLKKRLLLLSTLSSIISSKENVFVSRYMIDLTSRWIKPDKEHWHVIHNVINQERFKGDPERVVDYRYLLFLGSLGPHKNPENLVKAFKIVSQKYAGELKLVFVGPGCRQQNRLVPAWKKYLQDLITGLGLTSSVIFRDKAEGEVLTSFYRHAEVCVVPSYLESFGVVPGEALCCGTISVVSDIPAFREVYEDAVLYSDPYSPESIADAILRLLNDEDLRRELIEKGRRLLPRYELSTIANKYAEVFVRAAEG